MAEEYLEMEMASSDRVHECMQSITCEMKQLRPGRQDANHVPVILSYLLHGF